MSNPTWGKHFYFGDLKPFKINNNKTMVFNIIVLVTDLQVTIKTSFFLTSITHITIRFVVI